MRDRLVILENNLKELQKFKQNMCSSKNGKKTKTDEWALRYGLFESIQIVIDISCHLVCVLNLGNPKTYGECIELLVEYKKIDVTLGKTLRSMIGLRNILIHEYVSIDINKLYSLLNHLDDFGVFASKVRDLI